MDKQISKKHNCTILHIQQRYAGAGVQESAPAEVSVFQPEQDDKWIFLNGTRPGAGVIYDHSVFEILMSICIQSNF